MGWDDVGKDAKRKGVMHVSHARKLDPVPEKRPPGIAKPHTKTEKPFGFSYEYHWTWRNPAFWEREYQWFETKRARDQALKAFRHKHLSSDWYRDIRAESRGAPTHE